MNQNTMNSNNYPLTKVNPNKYIEGYWREESNGLYYKDSNYPTPLDSGKKVCDQFMKKLTSYITNCIPERVIGYWGFSNCRLCGKLNGSREYMLFHGDIQFVFPEGIVHYYQDHNVQPSKEFYEAIMAL